MNIYMYVGTEMIYTHRNDCRGCNGKNVFKFIDLGEMPLAGGFLENEEVADIENGIKSEIKIPLRAYYCNDCGLVQILDVIDSDTLFKKYFYVSSVIRSLSEHFEEYARFLKENYLTGKDRKILEFGCNDGVLLQYLQDDNIMVYGVDPSENVSKIAREKGYKVFTDYFNQNTANSINKKLGYFDVVTGSNVFAHVDDIREIIKAAKIILNDNGVFIVEVHYLKDLIDKFQYDCVYHEHLCYYSVISLNNIFSLEGMKIIDVIPLDMHGGAIRVISTMKTSSRDVQQSVYNFIDKEKDINLKELIHFGNAIVKHKIELINLLEKIKSEGKTIVGYGAPGRGTILLNYCNIDKRYLDYIVDVSPLRSGRLMPGVHVPIYTPEKSRDNPPDYFLLLAWNYKDSILEQERDLIKKGTKFIIPFPRIEVV